MKRPSVCIIGCGTYGSYLLRQVRERYGAETDITVIETGNEQTKSSEEIGIATDADTSKVSRFGRYFGLGGTSARWGGQILFFDERDVVQPDADWDYIVDLNNRHRGRVLHELLGQDKLQNTKEHRRVKNGLWLGYFKRNLFKRLSKQDKQGVNWITNSRVVDFKLTADGTVQSVRTRTAAGEESDIPADRFYLTTGALESCRLLTKLDHPALENSDLGKNLGDHVSVELFRVTGSAPVLEGVDFTPRFIGTSMFTKRLLVNTAGGRVNFAHVVPNKDVAAFTVLKRAMFGRQEGSTDFGEILQSFKFLAAFGTKLLFQRKLHIHDQKWSVYLDIEQGSETDNQVLVSEEIDAFREPGLVIQWDVSGSDRAAIAEGKAIVKEVLDREGHRYQEMFSEIDTYEKMEDTYHPVGFIRMGADDRAPVDREFRVRGTQNLYHFSTALFRSAKSINPTGAGFCLIEEHLDRAYPMTA